MPEPVVLTGPRVTLRPWRLPDDLGPLSAINGDPEAMRHFLNTMDRAESDDWGRRIAADLDSRGWGFWAVDLPGAGMVGAVGIKPAPFEAEFTPAVEIGWRIATAFQRRGLAEEAARLALAYGFGPARLDRIVAWTPPANEPSWRLMEKLGMRRDRLFDHPRVPEGHPLRPHLLYGIDRAGWIASRLGA
ncbi:GNAT family N-acetyltransferase [Falsiroseomonas oryzae]|uniref:GNAT family N-acetyltransferase n=1 Tax=Falsiroseomonas oryzae TaxID=2766473 RepID=UPI0022EB80E1|nr:GNAT family N-acetyltransferase [Roseomonas sp. MO-31]